MTVLIVDDEIDARDTLRDLFEDEGYAVDVAGNGREGLDQLATVADVRVVILDLHMPEMTGEEMLAAMRAEPRYAAIPVIIVTSDPRRAPSGVLTFTKPLRLDALLAAVTRLCA